MNNKKRLAFANLFLSRWICNFSVTIFLYLNHFNLYKQKVQLYDILEEKIWQLTPNAEEKQMQFIKTIERIELIGDRNRLKQIFLNIVQNAIKYSHKNGKVYIEVTKNKGQAVIKVKDEGIGIAKEHLPHIEQSFYQINNHATGAGLGLAIVKKMVELHGGTINIISKEGIGTTILIKLPL